MADNTVLNAGVGGVTALSKEVSHGGDTTQLQGVSILGVSGTEGAYTTADINGDATNGLDVDVTRSALPTGASTLAEQQTQTASLSVMDDWDETNRAAVNAIAGQVGVQGASGVATALTQRVVLATDVALPAGTNAIGKLAANSGVDIGDVDVTSIAAGDNNIGNVDIVTVPAPLSTTGGGTEATALRVTLASDSTGVVSVDDNGGSLTVDGSVTANAGTNLNTSALALEAGGNLAGAATSLAVVDDWDDGADRCKTIEAADVSLDGATVCTVKRFHVVTSTDGATIIAAAASKKFRLRSLAIFATSGTLTTFWLEDADGADVFGDSTGIPLDCDGGSGPAGFVLGHNPDGWFQTATANKNLVIKLTAAIEVVIVGTYIEVA